MFCFYLQTLCALFRGVHQKNKSASGFDIINMLMGFDKAEQRMKVGTTVTVMLCPSSCRHLPHHHHCASFHGQELIERLDSLLCGDGSESLKSLCLKLLLCLVTVRLNIWNYYERVFLNRLGCVLL